MYKLRNGNEKEGRCHGLSCTGEDHITSKPIHSSEERRRNGSGVNGLKPVLPSDKLGDSSVGSLTNWLTDCLMD